MCGELYAWYPEGPMHDFDSTLRRLETANLIRERNMKTLHPSRRQFMQGAILALGAAGGIQLVAPRARAENAKVVIKLDWLMSNGQIGDVMAEKQGFFKEAGLDVEFSPGGPNSATVPPVVSGHANLGQFSESTQLVAARRLRRSGQDHRLRLPHRPLCPGLAAQGPRAFGQD